MENDDPKARFIGMPKKIIYIRSEKAPGRMEKMVP